MSTPLSQRITDIEKRQADLERSIAELERAAARQVPWGWPVQPPVAPQWPSFEDARCPVCLARYVDLTHYVCNHPQCPSRITYGVGTVTSSPITLCDTNADASTPPHLQGGTSAPLPAGNLPS